MSKESTDTLLLAERDAFKMRERELVEALEHAQTTLLMEGYHHGISSIQIEIDAVLAKARL